MKLKWVIRSIATFSTTSDRSADAKIFGFSGIYQSSLEEFDRLFVLADIQQVRKLNGWQPDEISGFEISINNFDQLDEMTKKVKGLTIHYAEQDSVLMRPVSITSKYPQIFDWLKPARYECVDYPDPHHPGGRF